MTNKQVVVISAIAIYNAGALTILKAVFDELSKNNYSQYDIRFILHDANLIEKDLPIHIKIIELNGKRTGWIKRLYYEYFYFSILSIRWKPYIWFSLHEITPNVKAEKKAVYCHHPHLFAHHKVKMLYFEPTIFLFKIAFHILNWFTINKNDFIIVQQDWMREGFINAYNLSEDKVIVARPQLPNLLNRNEHILLHEVQKYRFIYPVYPRASKNIEAICKAVQLLEKKGLNDFEILLTLDGSENKYAKWLYKKYGHLRNIRFIGFQSSERISVLYSQVDYLIFPSLIESWGLPISEFKQYNKPIILADLPYARETLGDYDKVLFFDPYSTQELTNILEQIISDQNISFQINQKQLAIADASTIKNWTALFKKILSS